MWWTPCHCCGCGGRRNSKPGIPISLQQSRARHRPYGWVIPESCLAFTRPGPTRDFCWASVCSPTMHRLHRGHPAMVPLASGCGATQLEQCDNTCLKAGVEPAGSMAAWCHHTWRLSPPWRCGNTGPCTQWAIWQSQWKSFSTGQLFQNVAH